MRKEITIRENGSRRVQLFCDEKTMTQQHMKDECDINNILRKYEKTGMISHVRQGTPIQGDVSRFSDFKTNLDLVSEAASYFAALPSNIRKRFHNNAEYLVSFMSDPSNYDEAVKLGLVVPKAAPSSGGSNDDQTTITPPGTSAAT